MRRISILLLLPAVALFLGTLPALAQHGHGGGAAGGHGMGGSNSTATSRAESRTQPGTPSAPSGKLTINQHLERNTKLAGKLEGLLGLSGPKALSSLQADSTGFKNLGQFVAAAHVWHNLGFDKTMTFPQFRDKVLAEGSLGKAIHALQPSVNAKSETKKAEREAKEDLKESETKTS